MLLTEVKVKPADIPQRVRPIILFSHEHLLIIRCRSGWSISEGSGRSSKFDSSEAAGKCKKPGQNISRVEATLRGGLGTSLSEPHRPIIEQRNRWNKQERTEAHDANGVPLFRITQQSDGKGVNAWLLQTRGSSVFLSPWRFPVICPPDRGPVPGASAASALHGAKKWLFYTGSLKHEQNQLCKRFKRVPVQTQKSWDNRGSCFFFFWSEKHHQKYFKLYSIKCTDVLT